MSKDLKVKAVEIHRVEFMRVFISMHDLLGEDESKLFTDTLIYGDDQLRFDFMDHGDLFAERVQRDKEIVEFLGREYKPTSQVSLFLPQTRIEVATLLLRQLESAAAQTVYDVFVGRPGLEFQVPVFCFESFDTQLEDWLTIISKIDMAVSGSGSATRGLFP